MMNSRTPNIMRFFRTDPEDSSILWAVLPDDGTRGYVIGEMWEVEQLRDALTALIDRNEHGGEIDYLDEQLGWKWLASREAQALALEVTGASVPISSITHACRAGHIRGAQKDGRDWRFPQMTFLGWLRNRPKPGPKPAEAK